MSDAETKTQPQAKREIVPVSVDNMGILKPANLQEAIEIAKLIAHSGFVGKAFDGNPGAVLVAVQMGNELGLSPMAALRNIAVINGKPSLYGDGMLAVVVSHPQCEDVVETFDDKTMTATCSVKRRGRQPKISSFSMDDAKRAGLAGKAGPWTQYTRRMLQMRARGFALRDAFPDALSGIISVEEARDYDIIDGEFSETPKTLEAGDHNFGFRPKAEAPAPAPVEAKKQNGKVRPQVKHDPATGVVDEPTPEEREKWVDVGGPQWTSANQETTANG